MKKCSILNINNINDESLERILDLTFKVKQEPQKYYDILKGKNLGLIFEKPSTRTRVSFEVGMSQLGGNSFYLSPDELQPGRREPLKDIARTLSRYLDCLVLRTFIHNVIVEVDTYCTIPVINGLSERAHPCQALTDYFTIMEKFNNRKDIKISYVGDGNNVLNSLLILFSRKGMHFSVATPKKYSPDKEVTEKAFGYCKKSGGSLTIINDPLAAVTDADVIYTDVWISMGQNKSDKDEAVFKAFQVNKDLLKRAKQNAFVMHCLPAIREKEITNEVIESEQSIVFDQAENRLHVSKGVLIYLLT